MRILVITISDRAYKGIYEDKSGEIIKEMLQSAFKDVVVDKIVVPDEREKIEEALRQGLAYDFVLTNGGTGIGPRDITPDVTRNFIEKELPGIAEILRNESYKETPQAMLSRGIAGLRGKTIIVNFPGSKKAVTLCTKIIIPMMEHAFRMLRGEGH